jgi:peptidoglycan pentaglycine glycine transferase (the first glycine)
MKLEEIKNKKIWEKFISDYSPQSLFQSWNWGEVIRDQSANHPEQKLWRFGFYVKGNLTGIAQVEKVSAKRGDFLHIRHGPIFSSWKKVPFGNFIEMIKKSAGRESAGFIRISPLIGNSEENIKLLRQIGFRDAPIHALDGELCWVLDLGPAEEDLMAQMRKTTRYLIRQAQKLGVKIIKSRNPADLKDFHALYEKTARRHSFVQHKGIEEEFRKFLKDDQVILMKGYYQNKLLSEAIILFYNNQAIYHHSASIEQKIPVNYLLQWEVIREAKKRGMELYNFWGIAPEGKARHPWLGHTMFKKGFGGRKTEYLHAQDLPLSWSYGKTYLIEWARRIKKGY